MHESDHVLMGTTQSTFRDGVSCYNEDPATFPAGTVVRLASTGALSVTKADGNYLGISLGKSLSDTAKTAILKAGSRVPILLTDDSAEYAYVVPGLPVYIDDVTGLANIVDDAEVTTTISSAMYVSGPLTAILEDGTEGMCALIDMVGGL
jgi:hypothetical protein